MKKLIKLIKSALKSCEFRGHKMQYIDGKTGKWALYECVNCKRTVTIDTNPAPNGIDIGGEAVAVNCK